MEKWHIYRFGYAVQLCIFVYVLYSYSMIENWMLLTSQKNILQYVFVKSEVTISLRIMLQCVDLILVTQFGCHFNSSCSPVTISDASKVYVWSWDHL